VFSIYDDFAHDTSPYGTRRPPSQGHHQPFFLDDSESYFSPAHTLDNPNDHWSPVCSNIIPPPPPPMRKTAYLHAEYTSEDPGNSPASLYGGVYSESPVSALSSSIHSGASSEVELVCPAPIIPIGIGNYNHDEDGLFGSLGTPREESVYAAPIPDFGDRFNYPLRFFK